MLGKAYYNIGCKEDVEKLWKEVYKDNSGFEDVAELLDIFRVNKTTEQLLKELWELDKPGFTKLIEKVTGYFSVFSVSFEFGKDREIFILCKEKNDKLIISIKLWEQPAGDIALFDFKEVLAQHQARRGILILPYGLTKHQQPQNNRDMDNIVIIQKQQFVEIFNELTRNK